MKVAYIISMVKGGVPGFTYREIEVLTSNGYQVALFPLTYKPGPHMPKADWPVFRSACFGIGLAQLFALITHPARYMGLLALAMQKGVLREFVLAMFFVRGMASWGAEHIHCHFGDSKLYTGYFCSRWLGLPMTVTLHAYEIHRNPNPAMFKLAVERCKKVIVQSHFNKELVMRNFGVPENKIELIKAHGDLSKDCSSGKIKVLMVAEFREKKGHDILFSAVRKLGRKDILLWIVGDGLLDVRAIAEEAGLGEQTVFFGMLGKDVLNVLYDACDIFVQPSRTAGDGDMEGIPAVLMEAMSHAKPVISTKHAGIPELVEEVIVEENSAAELAKAISRLADDPDLRRRLGARNCEIICREYSSEAVLQLGEVFRADSLER
jgi:colanic acid/amylovoran biosynthesis glycosyltransferase